MDIKKDYYAILGLKHTATVEEIKTAYRKQAKDIHPDRYAGGNAAIKEKLVKMFQETNEAKSILLDENQRKIYDDYKGFNKKTERKKIAPLQTSKRKKTPAISLNILQIFSLKNQLLKRSN